MKIAIVLFVLAFAVLYFTRPHARDLACQEACKDKDAKNIGEGLEMKCECKRR